jgi:hypothetical protein
MSPANEWGQRRGAPMAHVGLHVGAVVHDYDTDLFLPPR